MFFLRKHHLLAFLIFISLCWGKNYNFSATPENSPEINSLHWKHSATNSAFDINGIEVDILNWRVAADSRESVQVELLNPIWDFIGWNDNELVLPNVIKISEPVNYRGTPTIYIQVTPWRIIDNQIEVLTSGKISITVDPMDFPITYSHPYLLNGNKVDLKRGYSENRPYLIICPSKFETAANTLETLHELEVHPDYQLNTEVIVTDNISGMDIRNYIIQRINDGLNPNGFLLLLGDENDIPPIFYEETTVKGESSEGPDFSENFTIDGCGTLINLELDGTAKLLSGISFYYPKYDFQGNVKDKYIDFTYYNEDNWDGDACSMDKHSIHVTSDGSVLYNTDSLITKFKFDVDGAYIIQAMGGKSEEKNFSISANFSSSTYPSDDFYSTVNIYSGDPQLASGRIPVSNENDAWTVVEKIKQYTLHPTPGIWRSKVVLVADDMYKTCSYKSDEDSHTLSSDSLYDALSTLLPIQPFYGVHYGLQSTGSGCEQPDLTKDLIRTINNGVALINYIGHGDPETWSGEKIITKSRDLPLIHVDKGKLAIWVAGTCSFGKYHGENSFMEELLIKEDGAIALVATTEEIGYTINSNYLYNFFGLNDTLGIQHIVRNGYNIRLGELILNSKNGYYHKFHTFGDPALRLPFPTLENIVEPRPDSIKLVEEQTISISSSGKNSTLLIRGNETELAFGNNSLLYTIPGATYTQMNSDSNEICFRIPVDAGTCVDCATIHMYQDDEGFDGKIQFISDISILESETSSNDESGPEIFLSQNGNTIREGSAIIPGIDLTISLNDSSGINLMETIGHGIRYAFDDNELTLISGDEFIYETCSEGMVQIPIDLGNSPGSFHFYLEAWDGVNNKSTIDLNLDVLGTPPISELLLSKVYPFPNPFSNGTHFTMFVSDIPANITITVYSLLGAKVIELPEFPAEESFIAIPWDGKSESGNTLANGAYFYHVKAEKDGKNVFEDIFKLAKVE